MKNGIKDSNFYNDESIRYSARRYPETAMTFTQYFFKRRLARTLAILKTEIRGRTGLDVLEIGCADGIVTKSVWKRFEKNISRIEAIDAAPEMIAVARRTHADTPILFSEREDNQIKGTYDLILEVGVLNYTDLETELSAVLPVLKNEGLYVCSIAGSSSFQNRIKGSTGYQHLWSYEEYEAIFQNDFRIVLSEGVGLFLPFVWRFPPIARVLQGWAEAVVRVFPSLALEKIYVLKPKES